MTPHFIEPRWPAPAGVVAFCTTRLGGCSESPYATFNLALHVGDRDSAVNTNRELLAAAVPPGVEFSWLSQVHGTAVIEARASGEPPVADAQWSRARGVACTVMTADCLPVLFCSVAGDVVAAAHAGWRGLLAGVLEATVAAMNVPPAEVLAWLGPAIGPDAFEVGPEVRDAFAAAAGPVDIERTAGCFSCNPSSQGHWFADLYSLARIRLSAIGVTRAFGGDFCTHRDDARFFSYRRDGQTGRMASLIFLR